MTRLDWYPVAVDVVDKVVAVVVVDVVLTVDVVGVGLGVGVVLVVGVGPATVVDVRQVLVLTHDPSEHRVQPMVLASDGLGKSTTPAPASSMFRRVVSMIPTPSRNAEIRLRSRSLHGWER